MPVDILWTGGWDSTYRILDLAINKNRSVQPYYVIDNGRQSTKIELRTMNEIKQMILELNPSSKILDTIIIKIQDISQNTMITNMYNSILVNNFIGKQYEWLAKYALSEGLSDLELCIHLDDKAQKVIINDVEKINETNDSYYKIKSDYTNPNMKLFSFYKFPVLDMTKIEMAEKAKEYGFDHIMEKTWFCHTPINGKPCGMCNPCKYTREEGLGRRVPNPSLFDKMKRKIDQKLA